MSADYPSDYDYPPPRRLQPATKFAMMILGVLFLIAIAGVIAFVAHKPEAVTTQAVSRTETRKPSRSVDEPPPLRAPSLVSEEDSRFASAIAWWALGIVLGLAYLALVALVGGWVARDASNRGMEAGAWALVFLLPHFVIIVGTWSIFASPVAWLGLVVYLLGRRRGSLAHCDGCGNRHLHYAACPHCGPRVPADGIIPPARRR
jgi:hypothetical protein